MREHFANWRKTQSVLHNDGTKYPEPETGQVADVGIEKDIRQKTKCLWQRRTI